MQALYDELLNDEDYEGVDGESSKKFGELSYLKKNNQD